MLNANAMFWLFMFIALLLGMGGMWLIGKFAPGTLGVTTSWRGKIAHRLAEMRARGDRY
jgi:hypothetical protein